LAERKKVKGKDGNFKYPTPQKCEERKNWGIVLQGNGQNAKKGKELLMGPCLEGRCIMWLC